MKTVRSIVFWMHLMAGVVAGLVILVMSVTGALLALKPQILTAIESKVRTVTPPPGAVRLGPQALLASVKAARPEGRPASMTLLADPVASASVALGRDGTIYVDPYSGAVLGDGSKGAQQFFRTVEDWHRWLSVSPDYRPMARSVTGASNLAFFFLALSGPYLWLPRIRSWSNVRAVLWFRPARNGRARDFNWHNVIGLWCAPILMVLTITGVVMSYPWANATLYRLAGSPLPVANGGPGGPAGTPPKGRGGAPNSQARDAEGRGQAPEADAGSTPTMDKLDESCARAVEQVPTWKSVTVRLPARAGAPIAFSIVDARSWNAFARSQLTVNSKTAAVAKWEPYDEQSRGQKWRGWVRFGHTGELAGLPGQIIAGVACVGGGFLVWTGLALAVRRLIASRRTTTRASIAA
ncbi:MAG TPA: PepSY-associated TM helix domain-containing protein [Vicinamibacterales bacterium]